MQTRLRHEYQQKKANTKSPHRCSIANANSARRHEVQVTPIPVREIQLPSRQRSRTAEMHASKRNTCLYRPIYTMRYRKLVLPGLHRLQHARSCFEAADTRYKFTATKRYLSWATRFTCIQGQSVRIYMVTTDRSLPTHGAFHQTLSEI